MKHEELRKQVVEIGVKMFKKDMTHGTSGNISVRVIGEKKILVTPSSIPYEEITPKDILLVGFDGEPLEGGRNPSVETPFHIGIYKKRDDVNAIVHSHSVNVLAVAAVGKTVPVFLDEMFSNIGGELEICEYALPGSDELAVNAVEKIGEKNAILLANHGAICCGEDLADAFHVAETVEKICKVFILSSILGEVKSLPEDGIEYQLMMHEMKKDF
jgi:L-fuculose-phosphate aldolase